MKGAGGREEEEEEEEEDDEGQGYGGRYYKLDLLYFMGGAASFHLPHIIDILSHRKNILF